uniref:ZP domain-containing protein n=1 Tax=Heterorhabditis bacteriophora TaxID=37862 RepID=A0A1I7W8V2_HETBA
MTFRLQCKGNISLPSDFVFCASLFSASALSFHFHQSPADRFTEHDGCEEEYD